MMRAPATRRPLPFEEAHSFALGSGYSDRDEWGRAGRAGEFPEGIPIAPQVVYKNRGWVSWGHWLGRTKVVKIVPYETAREYARKLVAAGKVSHYDDWLYLAHSGKLAPGMPVYPDSTYRNKGWVSYPEFFGWQDRRKKQFRPFEEARQYARSLGLGNRQDWIMLYTAGEKPEDIPTNPNVVYPDRWKGWNDWLGTKRGKQEKTPEKG
jgi:hypothetical protein